MSRFRTFLSLTFLLGASLFLAGCGEEAPVSYKVNLEVWGVFDDTDAFASLFQEYQNLHPFVEGITYRKLSEDTYKEDLLNAMASGNGPDIFMVRNTWTDAFADKTVPASPAMIPEKAFREAFVDVVAEDLLSAKGEIYALPLSADSLALYYNKDLFNAAGITAPPATWEEVQALLPRLRQIDQFGNITQSAVALGTGYNINRSTDVFLALAHQYGTDFSQENPFFSGTGMSNALDFYTQFARSGSSLYTWNPRLHFSIDSFYEGTVAMMFNYSWHYQTIKQKNAKFNFAVAPLPQFAGAKPVNFANYWAFAVAKNKSAPADTTLSFEEYQRVRTHEAWQLLRYLTFPHPDGTFTLENALSGTTLTIALSKDPAKEYLLQTKKPAARRDLIETQKSDLQLAPFAIGNLIAKSWKPGNTEAVETVLAEGIDAVNRGEQTTGEALQIMANRYSQFQIRR